MQVEATNVNGSTLQQMPRAVESIDAGRKNMARGQMDSSDNNSSDSVQGSVQPEEILNRIKALSENGLYSVRFESNNETEEMVIKVVDNESGEVLRQIPAEEILGMKSSLSEYRGNIVDTVK